ncbi:kinase-like protein, partial [Marasmius fiardii PR-910]
VSNGLAYLHSKEIVHGDLKSFNILITPSGRTCIADFGLSRVTESHGLHFTTSTSTHRVGTTRWLAPELLTGGLTSKKGERYIRFRVCLF